MSARQYTDKDYLFLSTMLRARMSTFISDEALDRMLSFGNFEEAAGVLRELGWPDMSEMDRAGVDAALSKRREDIFAEIGRICPQKQIINIFRLRYDYHNAKAIIKGQAMDVEANGLLTTAGRVELGRLKEAFVTEDYRFVPDILGKAMKEARDVLARTGNPQLADFVLDKAAYAEMKKMAAAIDSKYVNGYIKMYAQGCNLRACVRCIRMGKTEEFLRDVVFEDRYLERCIPQICSASDGISTFFATTPYREAALLGDQAAKGGRLTEFERACDNAMVKYLRDAKMQGFGPESVLGFLASVENDLVCARIVLNGFLSGLSVEDIKERLRDTYV